MSGGVVGGRDTFDAVLKALEEWQGLLVGGDVGDHSVLAAAAVGQGGLREQVSVAIEGGSRGVMTYSIAHVGAGSATAQLAARVELGRAPDGTVGRGDGWVVGADQVRVAERGARRVAVLGRGEADEASGQDGDSGDHGDAVIVRGVMGCDAMG